MEMCLIFQVKKTNLKTADEMGSHIKYIYFVIVCQFIVSLKLHVSKTTFLVFVCLKLMHAIILKIEEHLIVCLSHFLKICQIFPVSNYFDSIITNKRFVKRNLSKSKAELIIKLFNKSNWRGPD